MTLTIKIHVCSMYTRWRFLFMQDKSKEIISLMKCKLDSWHLSTYLCDGLYPEVKIESAKKIKNKSFFRRNEDKEM